MKAWSLAVLLLAAVLAEKALARPNAAEGDEDLQDDEPDDEEPSDVPAGKVELHSHPLMLTLSPGETAWLPCEVVNAGTVVWLKEPANATVTTLAVNDQRLTYKDDPRFVFHKNHTLEIRKVLHADASSYTCRADSLRVNHKIVVLEKSGAPVTRISFSLLLGAVVLLFTRS